ncbi:MAG: threonine--tRNA ligase [Patescibacteria group bacterium]
MSISSPQTHSLEMMRHSTAHLLAAALMNLYKGAKLGVGPVVEHGFYYDIESPVPISTDDFKKIEKEMREIAKRDIPFVREEMLLSDAKKLFTSLKQDYKVELIEDIEKYGSTLIDDQKEEALSTSKGDTLVSVYRTGDFVDLCRGPHVASTKDIGAFALHKLAGAYWRGNEANPQLTRIYGLAFASKEELDAYQTLLQEAAKRDHRKLGKDLELFTLIDDIGPGLPLFYPKGALLRRFVENLITDEQEKRGYLPIWIPHITKDQLYKISGHLDKYDAMYPPMHLEEADYYLKPMNCPHFMMLYNTLPHSYRDLPVRYTCTTTNYRYEKSGELSGLTRVRALTQDDCHVFCAADQIESEISLMLDMIQDIYRIFDFEEYTVSISVRNPNNKSTYIGSEEYWDTAERSLKKVVGDRNLTAIVCEGEAAFYGPKLDFIFKDALGRSWQLSTIQLDYNLPERFECEYADSDGTKKRPIVIHRAILGSTERFLGIMIEHFAGRFPLWLSPVQVVGIPVGLSHHDACKKLQTGLAACGIRCEIDYSNESVGKKIRAAEKLKMPYMIVIGDKEENLDELTIRVRGREEPLVMKYETFTAMAQRLISAKSLELTNE